MTALHKAAALSTAPEVTESTLEHYAATAADRSGEARATLLAAAERARQAVSTVVATASDVVEETRTEIAAEAIPQTSTAEAAPVAPTGTETTPVAAASPTTTQEGTIMSDPIDETLEHLGRHAGRTGQTIANEVGRQIQRVNDERRRQLQEAQRKADEDRELAERDAQRRAERQRERAERDAAREQERTERLAARSPNAEQRDSAARAEGAVLGAAAAAAIEHETDGDTAAITDDSRAVTRSETATIKAAGESSADGISFTGQPTQAERREHETFDDEDRQMMIDAGVNPDEPSSGFGSSTSSLDHYEAPEISRGDDGIER